MSRLRMTTFLCYNSTSYACLVEMQATSGFYGRERMRTALRWQWKRTMFYFSPVSTMPCRLCYLLPSLSVAAPIVAISATSHQEYFLHFWGTRGLQRADPAYILSDTVIAFCLWYFFWSSKFVKNFNCRAYRPARDADERATTPFRKSCPWCFFAHFNRCQENSGAFHQVSDGCAIVTCLPAFVNVTWMPHAAWGIWFCRQHLLVVNISQSGSSVPGKWSPCPTSPCSWTLQTPLTHLGCLGERPRVSHRRLDKVQMGWLRRLILGLTCRKLGVSPLRSVKPKFALGQSLVGTVNL